MFQLDQMYEFVLTEYVTGRLLTTQSLVAQLLAQSNEAEDATVNIESPISQMNDRIAQY